MKDEWGDWSVGDWHIGWTWRFRIWFNRFYYDGWHQVLHLGFVQIEFHHF